jgi:alpha-beta hydrolase superfamily lysophospholipase
MTVHSIHANPAPSAAFGFTSADGLRIACARWDARGLEGVRGVVQIAHGMGEHIGRYGETIDALVSSGFTVYGNDHRGHGRTARSAAHLGDLGEGGFDLLVEDMHRLRRIAREEHPGQAFFLFGHGMGSFAAQQYVLDHSRGIDGLILSGSGALDGLARMARSAPRGTNFLNAAFEPARTPLDWLSRDNAAVDAFVNDPLCFAELQPASLASFHAAALRLSDPDELRMIRSDLPIYLFSGSEDPVGQRLDGVRLQIDRYHQAGIHGTSLDIYPGGRHEMLNDIYRGEVRARLLRWIAGVLDRQPAMTSDAA